MGAADVSALADEVSAAYAVRRTDVVPPSARDGGCTLDEAYAVERELSARRQAAGHRVVGRKVGYANKAVWRALKLETLVWADMYDDTVQRAVANTGTLSRARFAAPKIEPEIVVMMRDRLAPGTTDAAAVLAAVEWIALGFEVIDCVYTGWTFQPADFVAAYGLHAALVVGEPRTVAPADIPALVDALARFTVTLARDGQPVAEGAGRNSLRSPALCVAELVSALSRRGGAQPLLAGECVSSGTLTESCPLAAGETWTATLTGLDLPPLTLHVAE